MGSKKIVDIKSITMSIIGFSVGFLFTNEVVGGIVNAIDYFKDSAVPTFVEYFGEVGGSLSFLAIGGVLLLTIALIKRWELLTVLEWIIIGAIVGTLAPILIPLVNEKLYEKIGWQIPYSAGVVRWQIKKLSKKIL